MEEQRVPLPGQVPGDLLSQELGDILGTAATATVTATPGARSDRDLDEYDTKEYDGIVNSVGNRCHKEHFEPLCCTCDVRGTPMQPLTPCGYYCGHWAHDHCLLYHVPRPTCACCWWQDPPIEILRDRLKTAEEDIMHERAKRREVARELSEHVQWAESTDKMIHALTHTTGKLLDCVARDETTWQHATMCVKRKAMRMPEYYQRVRTLETHLKGKAEVWNVIATISSSGPATTIIAKSGNAAQMVIDTVKTWATAEGIAREVAIFKGKGNIKRAKEKPLTATRNSLSEEFGTVTEQGKRLACQPHWPEFFSPDWALSANGVVLAWSEMHPDGFSMHVCINAAHATVVGQPDKLARAMAAADVECAEALYFCTFAVVPLGLHNVVRGRGTQEFGASPAKGIGKGGRRGRGSS